MATPIRTPRVNNNDDVVRFTHIHSAPGAAVRKGDLVAEIETDKASFTIEAEADGYVLGFVQPLGEMIAVGSVLAWLGERADEAIPEAALAGGAAVSAGPGRIAEPTLKAAILLNRYGLNAADVAATGDRLSAEDVLAHVARVGPPRPAAVPAAAPRVEDPAADLSSGERVPLSVLERGMLKTVSWHRDVAVAGYVEVDYDAAAWQAYAGAFKQQHKLMLDPLLPLMAYRLVQLAREQPKLNCTVLGTERHQYRSVNLGFTMQAGTRLTLLTVRDADRLGEKAFVDALLLLMRQGMKEKLTVEETTGATVSFSSMARWQVMRHMPILPPHTSLIVAHAHGGGDRGALGATYDHRVLTGGEVAVALRALAAPASGDPTT